MFDYKGFGVVTFTRKNRLSLSILNQNLSEDIFCDKNRDLTLICASKIILSNEISTQNEENDGYEKIDINDLPVKLLVFEMIDYESTMIIRNSRIIELTSSKLDHVILSRDTSVFI